MTSWDERTQALLRSAKTGDWSAAKTWAINRALEADIWKEPLLPRELLSILEGLNHAQPSMTSRDAALLHVQVMGLSKVTFVSFQETLPRAVACIRDLMTLCCVERAGDYIDKNEFDFALSEIIHENYTSQEKNKIRAQLHQSYQNLMGGLPGAFVSNTKMQGRTRQPKKKKDAPVMISEGISSMATSPLTHLQQVDSSMSRPGKVRPPPGLEHQGLKISMKMYGEILDLINAIRKENAASVVVTACVKELNVMIRQMPVHGEHDAREHFVEIILAALSDALKRHSGNEYLENSCDVVLKCPYVMLAR